MTISGPSEKAQQAAYAATQGDDGLIPMSDLALTFQALHDPVLGLDRSVCLRDVVEALLNADANVPAYFQAGRAAAEFIEREFGGERAGRTAS